MSVSVPLAPTTNQHEYEPPLEKRDLWVMWRATLSMAAHRIDARAKQVEVAGTFRRRVRKQAQAEAALLKAVADDLWALRERDPGELDSTAKSLMGGRDRG